ncbi:hypothetical protein [Blastococcus haudaquaticus]|uniref:Uncharacterized protein n=1 Tax=Blastococcus haudaquaticus TaxID=1938745 RepID=A0A286GDF5_9ACTN|nr:hypothetical protein [Blastococcus haudaquaticus]SOD93528.1 hypothetical protein SAMN06272739_0331 [Blastococcus haudaquaticus]
MISTMWTKAPADLLGTGGLDVRPVFGPGLCTGSLENPALRIAAPFAPVQGTGLPAAAIALRLRPATRRPIGHDVVNPAYESTTFDNNGTTLGIHSSRRPQS